jgi:hypothetical protein
MVGIISVKRLSYMKLARLDYHSLHINRHNNHSVSRRLFTWEHQYPRQSDAFSLQLQGNMPSSVRWSLGLSGQIVVWEIYLT